MSAEHKKPPITRFEDGEIYTSEELVERARRRTVLAATLLLSGFVWSVAGVLPTSVQAILSPETSEGSLLPFKPPEEQQNQKQYNVSPTATSSPTTP